jgi:hypothetical protein
MIKQLPPKTIQKHQQETKTNRLLKLILVIKYLNSSHHHQNILQQNTGSKIRDAKTSLSHPEKRGEAEEKKHRFMIPC